MQIEIILFDGFDELDAIGPYEVFQIASRQADIGARLVTPEATDRIEARNGLRLEPDGVVSSDAELYLVPGGGWAETDSPGVRREYDRGEIPTILRERFESGATVASVCTGSLLLEAAGLLEGRPAVTHYTAREDLAAKGVDVREERFIDDGSVLTAGGITSGIDLALHLVEREFDPSVAEWTAERLEYERVI